MKKPRRTFKITLISLAALTAWIIAAPYLAENLIVEKPLERADVILVLAGSRVYEERTNRAAELFKQGVAPKIMLTDDGNARRLVARRAKKYAVRRIGATKFDRRRRSRRRHRNHQTRRFGNDLRSANFS